MTLAPTPAAQAGGPGKTGQDRPIIFSAPMILALLEGRKTQTRRVLKKQDWPEAVVRRFPRQKAGVPYAVGDRLWVREAWAPLDALTHNAPGTRALVDRGFYRADGSTVDGEITRWRPSIHMPRWASRLTLIVTDVRVERLNDISEADAEAEGMRAPYLGDGDAPFIEIAIMVDRRRQFRNLWNSIHVAEVWAANPWVVAVTFTVHRANIDALPSTDTDPQDDPQAGTREGAV